MAKILNSVDSVGPKIPQILINKIQMVATFPLNDREAIIFSKSLKAVANQIEIDKLSPKELRKLIIVFTENGSYTVEDDYSMGSIGTYAVFSIQPWRDKEWSDLNLLTMFTEEMCHHFFSIEDEEEVKDKVFEIVKKIVDEPIVFTDLYLADWKDGYPHLY